MSIQLSSNLGECLLVVIKSEIEIKIRKKFILFANEFW